MKRKRQLNWNLLTWLVLVICSIICFISVTSFAAFPQRYKMPLLIGLVAIALIALVLTWASKKNSKVVPVINVLLSLCLAAVSIFVPSLEKKMDNIFVEAPQSDEMKINVYAFTNEYKEAHPDIMKASNQVVTSQNIADYANCSFITQNSVDVDGQAFAVAQLRNVLNVDSVWTIEKEDMWAALDAFYSGEGELLILNDVYVTTIQETDKYASFSEDTVVVYTIDKEISAEEEIPVVDKDITSVPFTVMVAGSDTRSRSLSQYGRTDVDIIMTVDPVNYQVLIVSIPRDAYIPNPSLGNGMDKLTHLGNAGIGNTMKGVANYFNVPIEHYVIVNFATFQIIVDAVGGIDIDNPYEFSAGHDAGYGYFPAGNIHLSGPEALVYVRERQNLPNGDYGRNEHQVIALKAIIDKLTSPSILTRYNDILNGLEGQFLTSMDPSDIYKLAGATLDHDGGWNVITYHLGGIGQYAQTASIPGRDLYVAALMETQMEFVVDQINKVLNSEVITQEEIPDADNTVYIPN